MILIKNIISDIDKNIKFVDFEDKSIFYITIDKVWLFVGKVDYTLKSIIFYKSNLKINFADPILIIEIKDAIYSAYKNDDKLQFQ
jgi:hypothetical protein